MSKDPTEPSLQSSPLEVHQPVLADMANSFMRFLTNFGYKLDRKWGNLKARVKKTDKGGVLVPVGAAFAYHASTLCPRL